MRRKALTVLAALIFAGSAAPPPRYDTLLRGGTIYDGSGAAPFVGDVGIGGDRIVAIAPHLSGSAHREIAVRGLAVAPGFVNMLSWANESLIADGRGESDILQGVTLEVMGEGDSMGPWNEEMKRRAADRQSDIKYPIRWTTLGQYLDYMERKGISPNLASFVGATTVRVHELGEGDVQPNPQQLSRMRALVREAMNEGAMGVGSSLIYAPATFAKTPELTALVTEAAKCGGMYISHMRNEGPTLLEAVDELVEISRRSGAPAEIYHFKQSGSANWGKYDAAVARVNAARAKGQRITADMYTYTAGATGLDAAIPTWAQDGGLEAWIARMKRPEVRARLLSEMRADRKSEFADLVVRHPDKVLMLSFKNPALKPLTGKTLAEIARIRGKSPDDTAIDLVIEDGSRVGVAYFIMDEANIRREVQLPWMSFGSDEAAQAPEGVFLLSASHPRAYGNFARVLGHYARDEHLVPLQEAVRRLAALPSQNLGVRNRGMLKPGYFADIAVFDPAKIQDHATYEKPQVFATGMREVFVNGVQVVRDGTHTGATPGRFVKGSGWKRCPPISSPSLRS
jgi:N-acyl-D-amino-acid deacylase